MLREVDEVSSSVVYCVEHRLYLLYKCMHLYLVTLVSLRTQS